MIKQHCLKSFTTLSIRKLRTVRILPRWMKTIAWVNILIQLLLPLSLSVTPAIARTPSQPKTMVMPTESYILKAGENVVTVAGKYAMSLDELKKLNRYRSFTKSFAQLTAGDEIDVPAKPSLFLIDSQPENSIDTRLANNVITGAKLLASENMAKSAQQLFLSTANSELNNSSQRWLGQFGTAQVQFNFNNDFRLDNSSVDVLLPLFDDQTNLFFTQLGWRYKDHRNTMNIGIGFRTLHNGWLYGINGFFDNDITGHNRRAGVGAEAWTDYLKLSANSYLALTNWHSSSDYAQYNERPANGYDVRTEAYLPSYPQLGGKLMYEQYYGNDVALFGKDNRQKNPFAFTAGLNYTPIPLVTLSAEHRAGKGGASDSSVNLQFNYRFGNSWKSHIDPSAVAATRTLAGGRRDLVERNNNIVLNYQKQAFIHLALPEAITAEADTTTTVHAEVNTQHPLDRIEWDSAALTTMGGMLIQTAPHSIDIQLPSHQKTDSTNLYTVSAIAYDKFGNASSRAKMLITVTPRVIEEVTGKMEIISDNAIANGVDTNAVQITITDMDDNPLPGQVVTFTANNDATVTTEIGTTGTDGIASATLSTIKAGPVIITAILSNDSSVTATTTFIANANKAIFANVEVTKDNGLADGSTENEVTATVTDEFNNPLLGQEVTFSVDSETVTITASSITDENGIAKATLTTTKAGAVAITAALSNEQSQSVDTTFVANASNATLLEGNLTVTKNNAIANGEKANEVQAIVTDNLGNVLKDQTVTFSTNSASATITASSTTGENGIAKATLITTKAGAVRVTAALSNEQSQSVDTTFVANAEQATLLEGNLTVTKNNAIANGVKENEVQAIVTDNLGNVLKDQTVTFSTNSASATITASSTTGENGIAKATLITTKAGAVRVTAALSNEQSQSVDTTFVANAEQATLLEGNLTVTKNNAIANGEKANEVQAIVTDNLGNVLKDQTVTFSTNSASATITASSTTDKDGIAKATLTTTKAGAVAVTAALSNEKSRSVNTTFVANAEQATLLEGNLTVTKNNAIANGEKANEVQAIVTDNLGNVLKDQTVTFSTNSASATITASSTTGENGIAKATLITTKAGAVRVTAALSNEQSQSVDTTFVANASNATLLEGNLTVTKNNAIANGEKANEVQAIVTDNLGNVLKDQTVTFSTNSASATITASSTTGENGIAKATLITTKAGAVRVTAALSNEQSQSVDTTFVANAEQATLLEGNLTVTKNNAIANGEKENEVQAIVTDNFGNPLKDQRVTFSANYANNETPLRGQTAAFSTNSETVTITASSTTDKDGIAKATLTTTKAGAVAVTAALSNEKSRSVNTTFVANAEQATLLEGNLTVTKNNAIANGEKANEVQAIVTDNLGNVLKDQTVTFSTNSASATITASSTTGENGIAKATLITTKAGAVRVTAALSNEQSQSVDTTFVANASNATLLEGNLTVTKNNAIANGEKANEVQAIVTDNLGNVLKDQTVTFSTNSASATITASSTTGENGIAKATLTTTKAGAVAVTAALSNEKSRSVNTTFVANAEQATLLEGNLTVTKNNAIANGVKKNEVQAIVTDNFGNPLKDQRVTFSTNSASATITASSTTDKDGIAKATLTTTKAGAVAVTAALSNEKSRSVNTTFVANAEQPTLLEGNLTVTKNNASANGVKENEVQAIVTDNFGNPLRDQTVTFSANYANNETPLRGQTAAFSTNSETVTITASSTTDENGIAKATLTTTKAGTVSVTALLSNEKSRSVNTTFVANAEQATLLEGNLTVTKNNAIANGVKKNEVQAIVTDNFGNPLRDQTVTFSANYANNETPLRGQTAAFSTNSETVTITASSTTDENGIAKATLTTTKAGTVSVTALLSNEKSRSVNTTFVANAEQATLLEGNLTVTKNNAIANGVKKNEVQAIVTDNFGNPLKDQRVTFSTNSASATITASSTTDKDGIAKATLTTTKAGAVAVTAALSNEKSRSVDTTFVANAEQPTLLEGNLTVTKNNASANGVKENEVQAIVTDNFGNPLKDQTVTFSANYANNETPLRGQTAAFSTNSETVTITASSTTDENGIAKATLTTIKAGTVSVTALLSNEKSRSVDTTFVVNPIIATGNMEVTKNNAFADNKSKNEIIVFVTDLSGNLLPGQSVTWSVNSASVSITAIGITDRNGMSKALLANNQAGTFTVTATLSNDNNRSINITFKEPPALTGISVNNKTFSLSENFPTTGFKSAKFTLQTNGNSRNFEWSSNNADAATVDIDGNVTLNNPTNKEVTISAVSKLNNATLTYSFTLKYWFTAMGSASRLIGVASQACDVNGMMLPQRSALTAQTSPDLPGASQRKIGSLFSEWGRMNAYDNFHADQYWTRDLAGRAGGSSYYYSVNLSNGGVISASESGSTLYTVCQKAL